MPSSSATQNEPATGPTGRWQTSSGITFNAIWDSGTLLPIDGNTETFTCLVSSMSIGIRTLGSDRGRRTLESVGTKVVQAWYNEGVPFDGDVQNMRGYVDHFLFRIRNDFPMVVLASRIRNPDNLAQTVRKDTGPQWDGNLWDYKPFFAAGFYFNPERVEAMAQNFASPTLPQQQARERDVAFQFLFGMTTCHELVHAFIAYLAGTNGRLVESYTPPDVTVQGYSQSMVDDDGSVEPRGESGRVFELFMYGGTVEFYRDPKQGDDQPGVPYLLDANGLARKITRASIEAQILNPENAAVYPLQTHPEAFDMAARIHHGLRSMGAGLPPDSAGGDSGRFMSAAVERYYVSDADARLVVSDHRKVQPVAVG